MIKVIDESAAMRESLKRAIGVLLSDDTDIIFVNTNGLRHIDEEIRSAVCPVIFYGLHSELSLRLEGNPAAPYIHGKNGAYFKIPFHLVEIILTCQKIIDGKKFENVAAIMASKKESENRLISALLHDVHPGKHGCESGLKAAKKEFGITGSVEEVRAQLMELQERQHNKSIKSFAEGKTLPGVFCDIAGTLVTGKGLNTVLAENLEKYAETKPVSIWTGGDLKEAEKLLGRLNVFGYPILSKYDFAGCQVEIAIDDLSKESLKKEYGIQAETYMTPVLTR